MMPDVVLPCHIPVLSDTKIGSNVSPVTPSRASRAPWAPSPAETVRGTASRRSGPRLWQAALRRALEAGLLPGSTAVTLTIAEDLAGRMDYGTGHVRYQLAETMTRTGLGRSTVTKHVSLLRAAGWLAWAEHGSLRNALRAAGRPGYAATAAVYGATVPPCFDEWAGNRLEGAGYSARVVGATERGREQRVAEAADNASRKAVDNRRKGSSWTPSLRVVKEEGQVQVVRGFVTTAKPQRKTPTILGQTITGDAIATAKRLAAWVRPLVGWLQRATRRQLSWVLLDLVIRGWDEQQILRWLQDQSPLGTWRPRHPHRHIASCLLAARAQEQRIADYDAEQARRADPRNNTALQEFFAARQRTADTMAALDAAAAGFTAVKTGEATRTDADRRIARLYAEADLAEVVDHIAAYGDDDALDLYGPRLCSLAERMNLIGALA
jgi:hypothetical protein